MDTSTATLLKEFANDTGISISAFINITVKQALKNNKLVIERELKPTPYLKEAIKSADIDLKEGATRSFKNSNDSQAFLESLMTK
jgi:antitoxin component of RelBE/YafQ-DinJ toxin-antitoxin module